MLPPLPSLALLALACGPAPEALAPDALDTGEPSTLPGMDTARLPAAMDLDRLLAHLDALQAVADTQGGTRLAATAGFDDSAAYVAEQLQQAGYTVTWQEFPHQLWIELSPPLLEVEGLATEGGFVTVQGSPPGEVVAPLHPVDLVLPPGEENSSTSGCEAEDFAAFPPGRIALLQRGTCPFSTKVEHAQDAGAVGAILFNEGQEGRQDVLQASLGTESAARIPVLGASFALGEALAAAAGRDARLRVDTLSEERPTWNLWADLPGDPEQILVVGAHLDSVQAGPGVNDNGSGTALVLELAVQAAALDLPRDRTLRFAFWGAEEAGLLGSFAYVGALSEEELERHVANLNFDMVASPNGARFVYDGDDSDELGGWPPPAGSAALEALFTGWLDREGLDWRGTAFSGRSDYGPFVYQGIPAGGLFTGAEGTKQTDEVTGAGGVAGEPYDACYHQACDTVENVDPVLFLEMARAAAWATEASAYAALAPLARTVRAPLPAPWAPPEHHHGGCGTPDR